MEWVEITFTERYKSFAIGERVRSTSPRSPLEEGTVYIVSGFTAPRFAGDPAMLFVEGREQGVDAQYVTTAEPS